MMIFTDWVLIGFIGGVVTCLLIKWRVRKARPKAATPPVMLDTDKRNAHQLIKALKLPKERV